MKRLINTMIVLAVLLTVILPVMANSAPYDVRGTKYEEAVTTLNALGVITGYNDGRFGSYDTITRAQFAAIAVRLLGLEDAAKITGGFTPFKDTVPVWAQGYVNVAVQQGIITGYADGSFGAQDPVTQSQAIAMLVRVLGYEPVVTERGWPTNYLVKATQLGLTKGIQINAYSNANRGLVALLANNALYIDKMVEVGVTSGETNYAVDIGNTLLTNNIGFKKVSGIVTASAELLDSNLDDGTFKIGPERFTANKIDGLYGKYITVWANSDNEVFKYNIEDDVLVATVDETSSMGITFEGDASETALATNARIVKNYSSRNDLVDDELNGLTVKYVLDDNDEIGYLEAIDYNSITPMVVDYIDDEEIINKVGFDLDLTNSNYNIDLDDIYEFDVLYDFHNSVTNKHHIDVFTNAIAGKFDARYSNGDYKIGGVRYGINTSNLAFSTDNGDTLNSIAKYTDFIGDYVYALLDKNGDIFYMFAQIDELSSPANFMVITNYNYASVGLDLEKQYYFKLLDKNNVSKWYELTESTKFLKSDGSIANVDYTDVDSIETFLSIYLGFSGFNDITGTYHIVDIQFDKDGTIDKVIRPAGKNGNELLSSDVDFIKDRSLIKVGDKWYPVALRSVFFDKYNQEFINWSSLANTDNNLEADVYIQNGEVVAVFISQGTITDSDFIEGIVASAYENADGDKIIEINQEGTITAYILDTTAKIIGLEGANKGFSSHNYNDLVGDFVSFDIVNGEVSEINELDFNYVNVLVVDSVGRLSFMSENGDVYYVDDEVQVYDTSGTEAFYVDANFINKGDEVIFYDKNNDGLYDIVVIIN